MAQTLYAAVGLWPSPSSSSTAAEKALIVYLVDRGNIMPSLELSKDEASRLKRALESYLSDLRDEIVHTDNRDLKEQLKADQASLTGIAERL